MYLQRTVKAIIRPGEQSGYVAECPELHAVTQGATLEEVAANLREAVSLALEDDAADAQELVPSSLIVATVKLEPTD